MGKASGSAGRGGKSSRGTNQGSGAPKPGYENTEANLKKVFQEVKMHTDLRQTFGNASLRQMTEDMNEAVKDYGVSMYPASLTVSKTGRAQVTYTIMKGYAPIGEMIRAYGEKGGTRYVEHTLFKLHKSMQGKDVGKKLLKEQLKFNQKAGFDEIRVHANIDQGGYAWARYGFKMRKKDAQDLVPKISSTLGISHPATQAWMDAGRNSRNGYVRVKPVVDKYKDDLKPLLLGTSWHGVVNLKDKQSVNDYMNYLNSSRRDMGAIEGTSKRKKGR